MFDHPKYWPDKMPAPVRPTVKTGKGLTKQSHRDETNINYIMAKYNKTGLLTFGSTHQPEYMAIKDTDFQSAMNTVVRANEMFAELTSTLRKKFNNNPEEFFRYVHDPANLDEMYELGLAVRPPPPPDPAPAPVTSPSPAPAPPGDPTP